MGVLLTKQNRDHVLPLLVYRLGRSGGVCKLKKCEWRINSNELEVREGPKKHGMRQLQSKEADWRCVFS